MNFPKSSRKKIAKPVKGSRYAPGIPGFIEWVKDRHPHIWDAAQHSPTLSGLGAGEDTTVATAGGATAQPGTAAKIITAITDTAAKLLPLYQQQVEFKTQLARAQAGQAPLDLTDYTGNAGYRVGMTSDTSKTVLMVAGLGVVGLLGFALLRGKKHARR